MAKQSKNTLQSQLTITNIMRSNPDIAKWRMALRAAENILNPNRRYLYDIYDETILDAKIISMTERIRAKCTNSKIVFAGDNIKTENSINKLVQTPIFLKFIEYIIEAKWYGHSLVEFEFENSQIASINLIPRRHVIPEKGIVARQLGDSVGVNYKEAPYCNYVIEIGEPTSLGLLNNATPLVIFKRMGLSNWAEFMQRFAIPTVKFGYDPNTPNAQKEVEANAQAYGSTAAIVMPLGTDMQFMDASSAGGSGVFKDFKQSQNDEMALLMLLQTMTSENGSSRSQAEIHQGGEDELIQSYRLFVQLVLNFKFKPLLALHGFDVEGGEFKYDGGLQLSLEQLLNIIQGLSQFGDIPIEYLRKHFGIDLQPKKTEATPAAAPSSLQYPKSCCSNNLLLPYKFRKLISREEEDLLRKIYDAGGDLEFDNVLYQQTADALLSGFQLGWNNVAKNYNSPDHITKSFMEFNIFRFSASKDKATLTALNQLLSSDKPFAEFEKEAAGLLETYNKNYLETEYNLAISTAQMSAKYISDMEDADVFPYWEYRTAGDDRVRAEHDKLDALLFKAGEMGDLTPPNGWGCRCTWIPRQASYAEGNQVVSEEDAFGELDDIVVEKMQKAGFAVNRTDLGEVFTNKQFYQAINENAELKYENYGLEAYRQISQKAKEAPVQTRTKAEADTWFNGKKGLYDLDNEDVVRMLDYNGRPLELERNTMYSSDVQFNLLHELENTIQAPDEVYAVKEGKGYKVKMFRYFKTNPVIVEVEYTKNSATITKYIQQTNADAKRTGILVKKSNK